MVQIATNAGAESVYFAQPYNLDATGFYFSTLEEYQTKADNCRDAFGMPVEEFELQFIEGENHALFNALQINQATLVEWFETLADMDPADDAYAIAVWLAEQGADMADIPDRIDDFYIFDGTAEDYAREHFCEGLELPDYVERYIDYAAIGRDMVLGGELVELAYNRLLIGDL
jgi:hypothetical protein